MSKQDDLVKLLTSESVAERRKGCNLAILRYRTAILNAIRFHYPKVSNENREDIAQKVCVEFYLNVMAGKYRHEGKLEKYLKGIARIQTLKFLKKNTSNLQEFSEEHEPSETPKNPKEFIRKDLVDKNRVDLLYNCVERLPKKLKDLYWRFYEDDQRVADIAAALSISKNLVKVNLYNLRNHLKNCVKNNSRPDKT